MINTKRLIIRNLEEGDVEQYFTLYNSTYVRECNCLQEKNKEECRLYIIDNETNDQNLAICQKDNKLIGMIYLDEDSLRYDVNSVEISFWIGEHYSQKGFMTEALQAVIDDLFCNKKISSITARVFATNKKSISLLKKMSFDEEGVLKRAVKTPMGFVYDDVLFSLFNDKEQ